MTKNQAFLTAEALNTYISFCKDQKEKDTCEYTRKAISRKLRRIKSVEKREKEKTISSFEQFGVWKDY
jgi:hypothetical protein